jgi:cobaltochelatase CobN
MLEAVRKGYWHTTEQVKQQLAREYIDNVLRQGVACCDHTCNNPALNQMVINIASLPGVMDPRLVEQFKIAIEKMAQSSLEEQLEQRQQLQRQLQAGFEAQQTARRNEQETQQEKTQAAQSGGPEDRQVTGYKMDKVSREDETTELSSSGIQWLAAFSVMVVLAVVAGAIWWRRRQQG